MKVAYKRKRKEKKGTAKSILLIGTGETAPSIEYSTGFRAVDPVLMARNTRGDVYLVVPQMEFGRANRTGKPVQTLTPDMLGLRGTAKGRIRDWALRIVRRMGVSNVVVPPSFPHGVAKYLQQRGIRVSVAEKELFPERAVKTPEELRNISDAQQAAVIAMRAAITLIADSEVDGSGCLRNRGRILTSESVREFVARILFNQNCLAREIIIAGGPQAADPHENGSGVLRAGETIVFDIFPRHMGHGYWGDLTRTVVKGKASPFMRRVYHAVKAAQSAALARVRGGVKASSVHQAAVDEFKRRGFQKGVTDGRSTGFIHSTGHGVGLAIHEAPSISTADGRLKPGNVITIEPGLYYPGVGGVRIEDTVVVTASGWRYLVPCEKVLEV
jgi:Xaa-Pro aminopeptidase